MQQKMHLKIIALNKMIFKGILLLYILIIFTIFFQKSEKKMENGVFKATAGGAGEGGSRLKRKPMFDERGNLQNGVRLSFEKGFGFSQNSQVGSAQSIDDNKIIYVLGKQVVLYDMLTENQRVIDAIGQEEEITCFKYYKNLMLDDNILYALYSANKIYPTLIVHNFSKGLPPQRLVLSHLEKQQRVLFLDLVSDCKNICVVSELEGNFRLSLVDIASKDVLCSQSIYFKVRGLVTPFSNDKIILLYSSTQIYAVQLGEQVKPVALKLQKQIQDQNIVQAISALENDLKLYLITNKGNLYFLTVDLNHSQIICQRKQFLGTFQTVDDEGKTVIRNRIPSSICCNQYNILIGYYYIEEFTLVKVCAASNINSSVQKISFSCPYLHRIVRMTFAHETMAVCVIVQVKENDKYDLSIPIQSDYLRQKGQVKVVKQNIQNHRLPVGKVFPVVFNLLLHDTLVETLRSPIQSVLTSTLLVQRILDICLIPTKKLFLILSAEKKVKAIKYEHISSTSFQRMLSWEYIFNANDNPTSLDTHPLTFNVAVGFKEGLKLFVICSEGLKTTNIQFPLKNCESVRYSKYGHKLVAGSLNQMIVINPYENKVINTVQFGSGYMVRQIAFLDKDMFLQGVFSNGCSMVMNSEGQRLFEVWNKTSRSICSAFDSVFDIMAVSYPDSITKFYRDRGSQQFGVIWTYPYNITKFLIVNQVGTIFMGTSLGKVKAHQWPFTDSLKISKYFTEIQLHSAAITELRVTHDYSLLISGAEDGSIFISRINAVSQGISVNDAQVLSSFKSSYKNYKTLYYLQHYMNTSCSIEGGQEETIGQLQSDKSDFDTEYSDIIQTIQQGIEGKLRQEQERRNKQLKGELQPLQQKIQKLNSLKISIRQEIANTIKALSDQSFALQQQKLSRIRELYKETDQLNQKKIFYTNLYKGQLEELKNKHKRQKQILLQECKDKEQKISKECEQIEAQCKSNTITYKELMKQEAQQGAIYKGKMIQEMEHDLETAKQQGQQLRKRYNKLYHDNNNYEQKMKYFQQLTGQLEIDIENATLKNSILRGQQKQLQKLLLDKDRQIFNQERQVKQLLTGNINNYTHQQYLKHKKEELLAKAKYLEGEINALDKKYNTFQEDFTQTSKQSKELDMKIEQACQTIVRLKELQRQTKQKAYLRRYKEKQTENAIVETYHKVDHTQLKGQLSQISKSIKVVTGNNQSAEVEVQEAVEKRDHLIKQVVNTNNLRKIDDSIRRTIMVKLNRETVSLTCEVNELRKQKKSLSIKLKELQNCIRQVRESEAFKQNGSVQDIVPVNISIIRKQASKHHSSHKLLPFQAYHHNKSFNKYSSHSRAGKDCDESTQLPSLLKQNISGSNQTSGLYGVQQTDDDQ